MYDVFSGVEKCVKLYADKWELAEYENGMLPEFKKAAKRKRQKHIDSGINRLFALLNNLPEDEEAKKQSFKALKRELGVFASFQLEIKNPEFEKKMFEGIMDVTERFISSARKFDPDVKMIDIMQAMRNVWIMNLIQLIAGRGVEYTPAVFAYSMLYPYTDNFLDDTSVGDEDKSRFNHRLSSRLEGKDINAENELEEKVFSLVGMIEGQYPRERYPNVYDSILSIQRGQIKSLNQQKAEKAPGERDILVISAEKGGTSVLADAYLVCGDLDENLFEFAFGFGFVLQLIDDLQDIKTDIQNGHLTVFSGKAAVKKLDGDVYKLKAFVKNAIDYENTSPSPYIDDIKHLITGNCILMIFEAVSKNRSYFTREYLKFAQTHSALGLNFFIRANRKINKKIKALEGGGVF